MEMLQNLTSLSFIYRLESSIIVCLPSLDLQKSFFSSRQGRSARRKSKKASKKESKKKKELEQEKEKENEGKVRYV